MSDSFIQKLKNSLYDLYNSTISIFRSIFAKPSSILFLGLDNAGKTTLLHKLKEDVTNTYEPTRHPSNAEIEIGNMKANIMDLGGHESARLAWNEFFFRCDGIVFLVDVKDEKRYNMVNEVWNEVLKMSGKLGNDENRNEVIIGPPVVVLMNKIDLVGRDAENIHEDSALTEFVMQSTGIREDDSVYRPIRIIWTSLVDEGLEGGILDAFVWLDKMIRNREKVLGKEL